MYLVVIAWLYVTVTMAIAEASTPSGSILGAVITLLLYGLLPCAIVIYILGTPARKRRLHAQRMAAQAAWDAAHPASSTLPPSAAAPDGDSHAPGTAQSASVTPVREEP